MKFEEEYFKERNHELEAKHWAEVNQWIAYFGLDKTSKVLVYGCGLGQRVHCFKTFGIDAVGYEISKYARDNAYGLAKENIYSSIPPVNFDLIVSVDVLEHMNDEQLEKDLTQLRGICTKAIHGITYATNHNFPKDRTHVNPKIKEHWRAVLLGFYDRVYDAPLYFMESDMYLVCMVLSQ